MVAANRREAVPRPAYGDAAGQLETDPPLDVAVHEILNRAMEVPQGGAKLRPVLRPVEMVERLGRAVVGFQHRRPERHHRAAWRDRVGAVRAVGNHRTVAGGADGQANRVNALHRDGLPPGDEGAAARGREVAPPVAGTEPLDHQVLGVGAGGGDGPGDGLVVAEDMERHARQGGAGDGQPRRRDPREVPQIGGLKSEMRVAGQDRLARCRAAPRHRPSIGSAGP